MIRCLNYLPIWWRNIWHNWMSLKYFIHGITTWIMSIFSNNIVVWFNMISGVRHAQGQSYWIWPYSSIHWKLVQRLICNDHKVDKWPFDTGIYWKRRKYRALERKFSCHRFMLVVYPKILKSGERRCKGCYKSPITVI